MASYGLGYPRPQIHQERGNILVSAAEAAIAPAYTANRFYQRIITGDDKMKNVKRLLALLFCLVMVFSMAACSSGGDDDSTNNNNTDNTDDTNGNVSSDDNVSGNEGDTSGEEEFAASGGQDMDTQVDNVVMTMNSTYVNVGPFAPSSPGSVGKPQLYAKLFFQPYTGAPIEDCIPWMAKGYEIIDDYTIEVEIYDYIYDSKGNHITADDVIWSGQTSLEIGQFVDYGSVASAEKIDDYTIRYTMTSRAPNTFPMVLCNQQFCIVDQEWYENAPDEERSTDPATTGAYTVKEFVSGSRAVLKARDDYWQTDPALNEGLLPSYQNVKTITYTAITEASMRVIALQNGEVDIAAITATDLGNFYDIDTRTNLDGWTCLLATPTALHTIFPNMSEDNVVGQNLDLRKAIFHALDAESIMLASGNNNVSAQLIHAFGVPSSLGYQSEWDEGEYWTYDPNLASEYLASAGFEPGELTLRLLTSTGLYTDSVRSVIISSLNAIGINVESIAVEQALFSTYKNDKTVWDLMMDLKGATSGHIASTYAYNFAAENYAEGQGGVNFWIDDGVYDLVNKVNDDPSDENIQEMEQYLRDNAAIMGMYVATNPMVAQGGITELGFVGATVYPEACVYAGDYVSAGD